ncbi:hypothetical protein J2D69_10340 [Lysinibacillus sphaericus]|uniref:Viral late gene transcription factor 3 zinc ribbon domain-containing protein n=2 Tax=Lysinibacillus TaxID=400634 RepID=W7S764_LYSSH|nr:MULTISPECIES: hypothetical protein [Lysinibacillus]MBE5082537.1 hypothetical protein [Bacillus thuringiensis]AMO33817.1 hypothetical protein AR327_15985 [Lysinibacillus sphaericus]AMR91074.1 hypothetical protein A1T07_13225 [Lysinibacillus sphaericus]ANA45123.1 hypothetical protein A2J09_05890 [Lysinibacillus sphaericus]EWH34146.1 hypothetical protein P799_08220 [Lysinibacillus sphaericus CBAM5]
MKITEGYGKVMIDDFEFYGEMKQDKCSKCKCNLLYYDDFDAYFCPKCNSWTESTCSDPTCKYCSSRPETPLTRI